MKIKTIVVGPISTNCYIAYDESSKEAIVIDAGEEPLKIIDFINKNSLKVLSIIATHGHFDHIKGVPQIQKMTGAPFLIHKVDSILLDQDAGAILNALGFEYVKVKADGFLNDGDILKVGNGTLKVIHTPGHSPGGICLYSENVKVLFSGDTLFDGDVGRTDFPGSSFEDIKNSVIKKLFILPDETMVYPGHGSSTTIIGSKENSYLKSILK